MMRFLALSSIALLLCCGAAATFGAPVMHGYLAAWLVCLSVPAGALPVSMALELAGQGCSRQTGVFRWLLTLLPVIALAGLPVFTFQGDLYPWVSHPRAGFAGMWFTPVLFDVRGGLYLIVWSVLAWLNVRPPGDRPRALSCGVGLVLHALVGTMAATDWIISLSPGFQAAGFGLLFMAGQSALAIAVALAFARVWPPVAIGSLAVVVLAWAVLHFTQYLIIWSADLPAEIAWYLRHGSGFGMVAACAGIAACMSVLWLRGSRKSGTVGMDRVAIMVFIAAAQLAGLLWTVMPAQSASRFSPWIDDGVLAGVIIVFASLFWAFHPRAVQA